MSEVRFFWLVIIAYLCAVLTGWNLADYPKHAVITGASFCCGLVSIFLALGGQNRK